jgi:hypothetical protein
MFGLVSPIVPVLDLDEAQQLYARLGFAVRRHDDRYGYAERDGPCLHLRVSPEGVGSRPRFGRTIR